MSPKQSISASLLSRFNAGEDAFFDTQVHLNAILLGANLDLQAGRLIAAGADRVYLGNAPELEIYQPELYAEIVVNLAAEHQPELMLVGSTDMGRELANWFGIDGRAGAAISAPAGLFAALLANFLSPKG